MDKKSVIIKFILFTLITGILYFTKDNFAKEVVGFFYASFVVTLLLSGVNLNPKK